MTDRPGRHPAQYRIVPADEAAPCVTGIRLGSGAIAIADPRVSDRPGRYTDQFRMQDVSNPAVTVTSSTDVQNGAQLIADPRINCTPRADSYGVQSWDNPAKTVIGSADVHAAAAAEAEAGIDFLLNWNDVWVAPVKIPELENNVLVH